MNIPTNDGKYESEGVIVSETKLKTTRQKQGLTQVQVAEKANITVNCYQRYENGERMPKANTAILIAKTLNSTVEELF